MFSPFCEDATVPTHIIGSLLPTIGFLVDLVDERDTTGDNNLERSEFHRHPKNSLKSLHGISHSTMQISLNTGLCIPCNFLKDSVPPKRRNFIARLRMHEDSKGCHCPSSSVCQ